MQQLAMQALRQSDSMVSQHKLRARLVSEGPTHVHRTEYAQQQKRKHDDQRNPDCRGTSIINAGRRPGLGTAQASLA